MPDRPSSAVPRIFTAVLAGASLPMALLVPLWITAGRMLFGVEGHLVSIFALTAGPVLAVLMGFFVFTGLQRRAELVPFFGTIGLFLLGYAGLAISTAPYIVPPSLTFWDAAAAPASQMCFLGGTAFLLPLVLLYTVFVYWIFRGKVEHGGPGYH